MKAIVTTQYGSPDVLQLQEIEKPAPKEDEIRIKIHATTVEATDPVFRQGAERMARLFTGLRKPKHPIPGGAFAGEVEAVGTAVTEFRVGDQVTGVSTRFGAHAEYLCLPQTAPVVVKPDNLTYEEAVAIHPGGLTALPNLRDAASVQRGQKVLINGASGAVGSSAVQLAKHFGADVTGVCSTANVERVQSFGADRVIDYTRADFAKSGQTYNVIFDAVGKRSFSDCKAALKDGGIYLRTALSPSMLFDLLWTARFGSKKAQIVLAGLRTEAQKRADLTFLFELARAGMLKPVIDRRYPLDQIAAAHRYVETGRKKGSVIITV